NDGRVKGVIFFGVSKRYTFKSAVGAGQFWFWLIMLGIFTAAILSYTIARRISKRVSLFAEVARSVADGKLDQEISLRGKDEIGDLASAFNLMIGRLRQMRKLEEELRRKDRLAALGELSAGVAHEVRNPLGIIKSSAQVLQNRLKDKEVKSRELISFIIEETDRLNKVVTNFLDFARPQKPNLEKRKIIPILDKTLGLVKIQFSERNIKVVRNYKKGLPPAMIDEDLMSQVFLNLITNALQAMSEGGILTVTVRLKVENQKFKTEDKNSSTETNFIEISFRDTGCGIPETELSKVFNPFFSIREGGTGLGLSIVHKIIETHGGEISVESQVGKGTTFTLKLPVAQKTEDKRQKTD
ncbi:MAG: HAMP domain-containing protein, partial [Nitrospirae bacterium]|nr:HAMP domain-containing protein [Nitrospirota bacterium]